MASECLISAFNSSLWEERRLRVFGGVAGLFRFAMSVVPLLAINTAKVPTPESAGSTSDMDRWAPAVVQETGYNLQYELPGHPGASRYLLPIATVSLLAGDSGTPKDSPTSEVASWAHLSQCQNQLFTRAFFCGFSIRQRFLFQGWADLTTACLAREYSESPADTPTSAAWRSIGSEPGS